MSNIFFCCVERQQDNWQLLKKVVQSERYDNGTKYVDENIGFLFINSL